MSLLPEILMETKGSMVIVRVTRTPFEANKCRFTWQAWFGYFLLLGNRRSPWRDTGSATPPKPLPVPWWVSVAGTVQGTHVIRACRRSLRNSPVPSEPLAIVRSDREGGRTRGRFRRIVSRFRHFRRRLRPGRLERPELRGPFNWAEPHCAPRRFGTGAIRLRFR